MNALVLLPWKAYCTTLRLRIIKAQLACLELIRRTTISGSGEMPTTSTSVAPGTWRMRSARSFAYPVSFFKSLPRRPIWTGRGSLRPPWFVTTPTWHRADVREFLSKVCHDFRHGAVSFIERLQLDIDAAFIDRRSCAAQPHRRNADFRLFQNRFFQWLGPFLHLEKATPGGAFKLTRNSPES